MEDISCTISELKMKPMNIHFNDGGLFIVHLSEARWNDLQQDIVDGTVMRMPQWEVDLIDREDLSVPSEFVMIQPYWNVCWVLG